MNKMQWLLLWSIAVILLLNISVLGASIKEEEPTISDQDKEESNEDTEISKIYNNSTGKDLYIIRKVVYEIGILTDSDNSTDFDNRTHEQIDVSFFDPIDNGTFIDLSNIPIPVETNVSGVEVTGILSSNFGHLIFPENGSMAALNDSNFPLFPNKQVTVTRNVSILDKQKSLNFLSGITDVLGFSNLIAPINKEADNDTTEADNDTTEST